MACYVSAQYAQNIREGTKVLLFFDINKFIFIFSMRNVYFEILNKIMTDGKTQNNKKGNIKYLTNEVLHMEPADLLDIFETHGIARKKLKTE